MSVVSVDREHSGEAFTDAEDGSHTISFKVVTNDPAHDDGRKVVAAGQLPARDSPHPSDPTLKVTHKEARRIGPCVWHVFVHYGPIVIGGGDVVDWPGGGGVIPVEWVESWGFVVSQVEVDEDVDGKAITNSAGLGFDPPLTREQYDLVLVIERNERRFSEVEAVNYAHAVNDDLFRGHPPGTCRLVRTAQRIERVYFRVRNEVRIRKKGWWRRVPDRGLRQLSAAGDEFVNIKDKHGHDITTPVPLDGKGRPLAVGAEVIWLDFKVYDQLPFGKFNL